MSIQLSVGEWKTRAGEKAVVEYYHKGSFHPWIGYINGSHKTWDADGFLYYRTTMDSCDIIAPWTSPIAPGHNPDKLTVERVGDGWWLPEWEVLEKVSESVMVGHFQCWIRAHLTWIRPTLPGSCAYICTYRTRLSREELLKLIAPKKRLIRVDELPVVCWVTVKTYQRPRQLFVVGRDDEALLIDGRWFLIIILHKEGWQWSSDLKTWNSFEVEDKE